MSLHPSLANPAVLLVITLVGLFIWACFKRRQLAGWIFLLLMFTLVLEGTAMNNHYRYLSPPTHIARQYQPVCGEMGAGSC